MSEERIQFLLKNARDGNDCKEYYSEYIELESKGLIQWQIGHAWITESGMNRIDE